MKVIYIAGPFRAPTAWGIENNIRRAEELGAKVAGIGAAPLIPHTMYRFFQGALPDAFWLDAGLELLRRCDGLITVAGWPGSAGTRGEIAEAERIRIPVFDHLGQLNDWLKAR